MELFHSSSCTDIVVHFNFASCLIRLQSKAPLRWTPVPNDPTSPSACCERPRGEASPRRRDAQYWVMALLGSGTPPRNCSPKPIKSSIATTRKTLCTEPLTRSSAPPALKPNHGPRRAVTNWMLESCRPSSERSGPISALPMKPRNVPPTLFATVVACAIQSSTHRVYVPLPASWKPDAKWRSGPGSREQVCTGASLAPTPSSRCGASNSVDDSRISGNVAHRLLRLPREFTSQIWSAP